MYPNKSAFAVEAYKDATREPYSYLFVDLRPEQNEELRLRTNIFSRRNSLRLRVERMSARVKKYLPVLKRIRKIGDRAKRQYVRKCDREFVDCVSECAKNVIKGNVPLQSCVASDRTSERCRRRRRLCGPNARFYRKMAFSPLYCLPCCRSSAVYFCRTGAGGQEARTGRRIR